MRVGGVGSGQNPEDGVTGRPEGPTPGLRSTDAVRLPASVIRVLEIGG